MGKTSTFTTQFKRRREGKTNYKKRLALLKSGLHRLVVRKTNNYIIAQVVEFKPKGDKTVVHVNSSQLEKFGWKAGKKSLPAAYLTGLLAGTRAKQAKVEKAILDTGFAIPKHRGWWASALKGTLDSGLELPAGKESLPNEERASGKHIGDFAGMNEKPKQAFGKIGKKTDLKHVTKMFEEVKQKIMQSKEER